MLELSDTDHKRTLLTEFKEDKNICRWQISVKCHNRIFKESHQTPPTEKYNNWNYEHHRLKRKLDMAEDRTSVLPEWSPTILSPGTHFVEDKFSMDWRRAGWFQDDSSALHLLCTLLFLHQLHLRSLGIRSQRLGITELYDMQEDTIMSLIQHGRHMDRKYRIKSRNRG